MTGFEITLTCLALNIYKEGRGDTIRGQQAIALVTLNRAREQKTDICEVVFQPSQFSWTITDIHHGVLKANAKPDRNSKDWIISMKVAKQSFTLYDFTNGATFFHATYMNPKPSWVGSMNFHGRFGLHYFYKPK